MHERTVPPRCSHRPAAQTTHAHTHTRTRGHRDTGMQHDDDVPRNKRALHNARDRDLFKTCVCAKCSCSMHILCARRSTARTSERASERVTRVTSADAAVCVCMSVASELFVRRGLLCDARRIVAACACCTARSARRLRSAAESFFSGACALARAPQHKRARTHKHTHTLRYTEAHP